MTKKTSARAKLSWKENLERSEEVTKGKNLKQTDTSKSGCGRCGGAPLQQKCKAINSKCPNSHEVGPYQCMCFKMKPSGVNRLHGERSNPGESDPYGNILLGTLTAEHCSQSNNWTGKIDNIQSHQDRTKALIEMQLTAKPCHRHTTSIICKIDTGAEMNLISMQVFQTVVTDPRQRQLGPPQCKITTYGGDIIENPGSCQLYIHHKGDVRAVTFEVTKVLSPPMLGCKTCSDFNRTCEI